MHVSCGRACYQAKIGAKATFITISKRTRKGPFRQVHGVGPTFTLQSHVVMYIDSYKRPLCIISE